MMEPIQWCLHENMYCERCKHDRKGARACPVKLAMRRDASDPVVSKVFERLGYCSQYEPRPPRTTKGRPGRGRKSKSRRG